jgi:O-antigen ligase
MIRMRRLTFDWQIVPWSLSVLLGGLIASDSTQGAIGFSLAAFGVALYLFFHNLSDGRHLRLTLMLLPPLVTIAFLIAGDWSQAMVKLPLLDSAFVWFATLQPNLGFAINSNVAAGVLAMLLPLQAWALRNSSRTTRSVLLGISLGGLVLSASRGAWLALVLAVTMALTWGEVGRRFATPRKARVIWLVIIGICALILIAGLGFTSLGNRLLNLGGDRPAIWKNSVDLLDDYAVTGLGFGSFEMAYSTYTFLTHVGHRLHAHNLWLNVWLDQGVLGAIALAGLTLNAVWPRANAWHGRLAGLTALSVVLIHGLFDDAFYGYGGATIPLLLIPIALATRTPESQEMSLTGTARASRFRPAVALWAVAVIVSFAMILTPGGHAAIEANLGAVAQTRAELSVYRWPEVPIQDVLREPEGVNLSAAIEHYDRAMILDSTNATANRRLGQIELARREYGLACDHLQQAFAARPDQRATRQLLGECFALEGESDRAAQLWRDIDLTEGQITGRLWWYGTYLGSLDQARRIKQAADLLDLEP